MKHLLLALLLLPSALVLADESSATSSPLSSPVYINLNSGFATLDNLPTGEWTGSFNAGYNFNPYFALEGGYTLLAGSQFGITSSTYVFDVAAKGTLPLSEIFAIYGRAGAGFGVNRWSGTLSAATDCSLCNNNANANEALGLLGLGVSFNLSRHFDLRVEDSAYIPFSNATTGMINAVTGGVQYNF